MRVPWLHAAVAVAVMSGALVADTARPADRPVATPEPADRNTALPRETECPVPLADNAPVGDWSAAEQWAWDERLCLGEEANFAQPNRLEKATCLSPDQPEMRQLSEAFLRTVLFYEPFRSAWGQRGLRVVCAYFAEEIDLSFGAFPHEIMIRDSYLAGSLKAESLVIDDTFVLARSRITGSFSADSLRVNGDLILYNSHFGIPPADAEAPREQTSGEIEAGAAAPAPPQDAEPAGAGPESPATPAAITLRNADIAGDFKAGGAVVFGKLDAHHLSAGGSVAFDGGTFRTVDLSDAEIEVDLSADGARFGDLVTARVHVGARLLLRRVHVEKVNLLGARIDGDIRAGQATLCDVFNGTAMRVLGDVDLRGLAALHDMILEDADIQGSLEMSAGTLNAPLWAPRLSTGGDVRLGPGARFRNTLDLTRATVGGDLALVGSDFHGDVLLTGGQVDGDFRLGDVEGKVYARWPREDDPAARGSRSDCRPESSLQPPGEPQVLSIEVGQPQGGDDDTAAPAPDEPPQDKPPAEESSPEAPSLDEPPPDEASLNEPPPMQPLPDCRPPADFQPSQAALVLTDLSIGTLLDHPAAWCDLRGQVHMVGFRYERLGRVARDYQVPSEQWVAWLINWLGLQHGGEGTYSHQPYQHLADTLRAQNFHREADAIMVAANDARRSAASTPLRTQAVLWVSGMTTNYGYGVERAIIFTIVLIIVGVLFVRHDRDKVELLTLYRQIWYSLDMLMPINISPHHQEIRLGETARNYFLIHRVIGLVLWGVLLIVLGGEFTGVLS